MMSSLSLSSKQSAAFSLSLSDQAGVLAPTTIFKYDCAFQPFLSFCQNFDLKPIPSIDLFSMYISVTSRKLNP